MAVAGRGGVMGRKALNLIGRRYGRLEVIGQAVSVTYSRWQCRCDCGGEIVATSNVLNNGYTRSCGCLHREQASANLRRLHAEQKAGPAHQYNRAQASTHGGWSALSSALGYGE